MTSLPAHDPAGQAATHVAPLLRLSGIVKTFPGVRALDGVELEVLPGEVHCLLGQNGAGKSTLIKILSGVHQPDAGRLEWDGQQVRFTSPQAAMKAGIATIYQELDLVDGLSVAENIFLGHEPRTLGFVKRGVMRQHARELLGRLGHAEIPVHWEVGRLPAAAKQIVSMARALSRQARLMIMDEPSAVLAHDEVANLFRVIRELTSQQIAVIYISHRLEEIREIGDRVTVLKDGRTSAVGLPARTTPTSELVAKMTGRAIEYVFPPRRSATPATTGTHEQAASATASARQSSGTPKRDVPLLRVVGLSRAGEFHDISFDVSSGEIVGIAGLVGSGRSELLETIYGARRPDTGQVFVEGRRLRPGDVRAAVRAGVGMAPEERKSQALLLDEPVYRNITLATFPRYAAGGFTRSGREITAATTIAHTLQLRPPDVRRITRTLSGGNQQKVVVGRWLVHAGTRLLLLDEPTRGVDVGARAELYQVIRRLADEGMGVLLVSSEVPEVLGLADRVLVMREGRLIHTAAATELDEHAVLDLVMAGSLLEQTEGSPV